jgi:hypothetical protein
VNMRHLSDDKAHLVTRSLPLAVLTSLPSLRVTSSQLLQVLYRGGPHCNANAVRTGSGSDRVLGLIAPLMSHLSANEISTGSG